MKATERQRINESNAARERFVICPECNGFGIIYDLETDGHHGTTTNEIPCSQCEAKGIVKQIIFEIPTTL